jgi:hypothetical protein
MSATLLLVGAVLLALGRWRSHLWPMVTLTGGVPGSAYRPGRWLVDNGMMTVSGERLHCVDTSLVPPSAIPPCMAERGGITYFTDYHPASHFWPLQLVETGIVLLLAALATFAAFRVLRRLHG